MKYSASSVWENKDRYDIVVVGAGHAGCEAALASARLGFRTLLFTINIESIAMMPCNPNIGGSSKGHLVREVDALGGEMGKVIDRAFIQSKMLNQSKGPAVHSLRAQADKADYGRKLIEYAGSTSESGKSGDPADGSDGYFGGKREGNRCKDLFRCNLSLQRGSAVHWYIPLFPMYLW